MRNVLYLAWAVGLTLSAQIYWRFDPSHSRIGFRVKHMGISEVDGEFRKAQVNVVSQHPDRWDEVNVEVIIDAASIDTRNADRDEHLRSEDFLAVAQYPTIRFKSDGMRLVGTDEETGAKIYEMPGKLTIRGIERPVVLTVHYFGTIEDPWGNVRAGFRITGEIDRADFGIHYEKKTKTGNLLIGRTIRFDIPVELIKSKKK